MLNATVLSKFSATDLACDLISAVIRSRGAKPDYVERVLKNLVSGRWRGRDERGVICEKMAGHGSELSSSPGDISCLDDTRPARPLSILGPPLGHFLEKFSFASARIIAMSFNVSYCTVKDIFSRELGLRKFSRRCASHQLSGSQK